MSLFSDPYTIEKAAEALYQETDPRAPLQEFFHDFWGNPDPAFRQYLVQTPPPQPKTLQQKRWAALCAALVEEMCLRTHIPMPQWITDEHYVLSSPWHVDSSNPQESLPTFKKRNIFTSPTILDNKYQLREMFPQAEKGFIAPEELFGSNSADPSKE